MAHRPSSAGSHLPVRVVTRFAAALLLGMCSASVQAADYVLTIAGGYSAEQNQASLEANVLFFQQLLRDKHPGVARHELFFADGADPKPDLQVLAAPNEKSPPPLTTLIASIHRRGDPEKPVEYRNHEIPEVTGGLAPELIHTALTRIAHQVKTGDRLLVYVTAHGREGNKENPQNTTISCWDEKSITVRQFSQWLNEVPADVPVILVMAQCYCGGFANVIYTDVKSADKLDPHSRIGFFAQQFDLPAAGCRPDIEQDQEFSSYFWGAMVGKSRNGQPMYGADADGDKVVSFDEAFAHAVIVGETVDIPLRASDLLLRQFSRIPDYTLERDRQRKTPAEDASAAKTGDKKDESKDAAEKKEPASQPSPATPPEVTAKLLGMTGTLREIGEKATAADRRILFDLSAKLDLQPDAEVDDLLAAYRHHQQSRPAGPNRRRGNSGRRELFAAIEKKWPELVDPEKWEQSPLLSSDRQQEIYDEIVKLPSYTTFDQRRRERERQAQEAETHELREVKYRRLVETLETVVLAENLAAVAKPEIVARYQAMKKLEATSLAK